MGMPVIYYQSSLDWRQIAKVCTIRDTGTAGLLVAINEIALGHCIWLDQLELRQVSERVSDTSCLAMRVARS